MIAYLRASCVVRPKHARVDAVGGDIDPSGRGAEFHQLGAVEVGHGQNAVGRPKDRTFVEADERPNPTALATHAQRNNVKRVEDDGHSAKKAQGNRVGALP